MSFASSAFVGTPRSGAWASVGAITSVVRVDRGREDGAQVVEMRFGPFADPAQAAMVRDGERLLVVSRVDGALLHEVVVGDAVAWDRLEVSRGGDRLTLRLPLSGRSPVRVAPRLRGGRSRRTASPSSPWRRAVDWLVRVLGGDRARRVG
ncbi:MULTISPECIES: hypothetical protein [unclassified Nocardiopsis]|uniref:hypothetical protein n=1 Tax=unclassified Nocardiopsis TaxID=2649073 RepID=UPI00135B4BF1|nr:MULTISPECIES: hypothetical protein [unclassified Nocardiopsis]